MKTFTTRRKSTEIQKMRKMVAVAVGERNEVGEVVVKQQMASVILNVFVVKKTLGIMAVLQVVLDPLVLGLPLPQLPVHLVPMHGSLELNTDLVSTSLKLETMLSIFVKATLQLSLLQAIKEHLHGKQCTEAVSCGQQSPAESPLFITA
jgi:hypothetical protein